ncbi:hypothetical protein O3M35_013307 [Rhynocoris fuscipes]|uniref:HIG1 domain-containing protein n=1 Tax=Rhynocoris fuscipes TaxID=488301 RepID=A0AAW1CGA2_9HEMI
MQPTKVSEEESFDWLKVRQDIGLDRDDISKQEGFTEKLMRRFKENPFVPIGCLATVGCLTLGLFSFHRGERRMSQLMMRARVVAQGFTVVALVAGVSMTAIKKMPPA